MVDALAFKQIDRRVEIAGDAGVLPQPAGLDRQQPQRRIEDHAGQAHAAQRRREQRGVLRARAADDLATRQREAERLDDGAEAAVAMMVLAVDVGRNRTADRHEFGAGHDLEEKPRGSKAARMSAMVTPASTVSWAVAASKLRIRFRPREEIVDCAPIAASP